MTKKMVRMKKFKNKMSWFALLWTNWMKSFKRTIYSLKKKLKKSFNTKLKSSSWIRNTRANMGCKHRISYSKRWWWCRRITLSKLRRSKRNYKTQKWNMPRKFKNWTNFKSNTKTCRIISNRRGWTSLKRKRFRWRKRKLNWISSYSKTALIS